MVSPKLLKVFEILESYETNPDFCGIIFLEKRSSCTILADMIRNRKSLSFINPGILVGHGGGTGNSIKMISREQEITVKRFRQGSINLLIATKIGEEGIDIPKCLLVVRLTLFQNLIDYIQSRGRARKMESRYIVLLEENDEKALKHYQDTLAKENEMNASMANRTDEDEETSSAFILSEDVL